MMIENEYGVAAPALAAGALAFIFIAYLYSKLSKFETGTDIGVPQLDGLSLQVGPRTPSTHTPSSHAALHYLVAAIPLQSIPLHTMPRS